ncbi:MULTISPECIES: glutathione binding-like protein [unclassified Leptolyngbya]|uniref:glutathione binding-like protein n=1 Tax=unclassified Leptolyngbya TaxID=2650499 RepID=UPI0016829B99|nr:MULTISPECIES: glutathione binding-like protein [unclassified Leptolyngbya]MBD1911965.1 glutathione S-transferase N-terminal domain-containing protein [Leptolyngbya sp. FACHB-8]MBD2157099.1 glutathione S-transferase N-terminal domain-containing protein [Leptolyngbya sp. FACHB-16]
MIDFYTFTTPNGRKASIMLEETELKYTPHVIDIRKGDQFTPEFVAINPNSKIPAIVDHDTGLNVFESGAILIYLAEKTGKFLPTDLVGRSQTLQWLMFQMGGVGPMFGQMNHFRNFAPEQIPYGIERYTNEAKRLLGVMDKQLERNAYLAGADYTIADIATFPWVNSYQVTGEKAGLTLEPFPHVKRWHDELLARPAVQRGMQVPQL